MQKNLKKTKELLEERTTQLYSQQELYHQLKYDFTQVIIIFTLLAKLHCSFTTFLNKSKIAFKKR